MSALKPGLAKIIVKVRISRYSENSETDHHIAANVSSVDYVDTWSLTPGHPNKFIDFHKATLCIAVLPMKDVKTQWNSTLELPERAY